MPNMKSFGIFQNLDDKNSRFPPFFFGSASVQNEARSPI